VACQIIRFATNRGSSPSASAPACTRKTPERCDPRYLLLVCFDAFTRIAEPHAYGVTKDGHEVIRPWQVSSGAAGNEKTAGWKLLQLNDTRGLSVISELFEEARPRYMRDDKVNHHIYTRNCSSPRSCGAAIMKVPFSAYVVCYMGMNGMSR
jgi:hypothetical protein